MISYPPPVAVIEVSSPVRVGQPVSYIDGSYDPAPGHVIVFREWIGREPLFPATGTYEVILWVLDDRGLWGEAARSVQVLSAGELGGGSSSGTHSPSWQVQAPTSAVQRGEAVPISVRGTSAKPLHFVLPAAFRTNVVLDGSTVDYATLNGSAFTRAGNTETGILYVPWTTTQPADGAWSLKVSDGQYTESFTLNVKGTLVVQEAARAFAAASP